MGETPDLRIRIALVTVAVVASIAVVAFAGAVVAESTSSTSPIGLAAAQEEDDSQGNNYSDVGCGTGQFGVELNNVSCEGDQLVMDRKKLGWDIDNLTRTNTAGFALTSDTVEGIEWGDDGNRIYVVDVDYGTDTTTLREVSTAGAYNISDPTEEETESLSGFYTGIDFSPDGEFLYLINISGTNSVERYTLSENWNISTRSSSGSIDVGFLGENVWDIEWSAAGEEFHLAGVDEIHEFEASTHWSTTASLEGSHSWPSDMTRGRAIRWKDDNANLNFSGISSGDRVDVPDDSSLNVTGDITLAYQVYLPRDQNIDGSNNWRSFIRKGDIFNNGYSATLSESHQPTFRAVREDGVERITSGYLIPVGEPHSVVFSQEGSTGDYEIFINGSLVASGSAPGGDMVLDDSDVQLGYSGSNHILNGDLDRVVIDDRTWDESEAAEYHDGGVPQGNMELRIEADEGKGTTAEDASINNNDGTLTSSTDWTSGNFSVAGERMFVLDNDDPSTAGTERLYRLAGGGDYDVSQLSIVRDVDASHFDDTDDRRAMAWHDDGDEVTLAGCCSTGLFTYDAGYHPVAYGIFSHGFSKRIYQTRLNWSDNQVGGRIDYAIRNGASGSFTDVSNREDEWIDVDDVDDDEMYVRVSPVWDGQGRTAPEGDRYDVAVDLLDATGLDLQVPTELGLNDSGPYNVTITYENGSSFDRTQEADTTVNRSDVIDVFASNGTLVSNVNSSDVAVNTSLDEDGTTWVDNETMAVYGERLQDYKWNEDVLIPILIMADWGWVTLLVATVVAGLVARQVSVDVGVAVWSAVLIVAHLLGFIGLEIAIFSVVVAGLLIWR